MTLVAPTRSDSTLVVLKNYDHFLQPHLEGLLCIDTYTRLIPASDLPLIVAELEAHLTPASPREAAGAVAKLMAPYRNIDFHDAALAGQLQPAIPVRCCTLRLRNCMLR
jgi:hypothetical protein